ncbi:UTRA domain-containing protein [Paenochrobactrum glaciei]|uniref:Histidine utilization repressor n=1 Tax=Paenochrobactrum glaciei TaxID=486407 RepID=A0ABN1G817_9HYPH
MNQENNAPVSLSEQIQKDIEENIINGHWAPGDKIPSESDFMEQYQCSRMTVNRVLSRLAERGLINRRRKAGSFVSAPQADSVMFMQIRDFAKEAKETGQQYRHEILLRREERIAPAKAKELQLATDHKILRILCLHIVNEKPEAYEDRIISLAKVPEVAAETFEETPPGTWLLGHIPWNEAKHTIRAINADTTLAGILGIETNAACLKLNRRTWHRAELITDVDIIYPGLGHEITGVFSSNLGSFPQVNA